MIRFFRNLRQNALHSGNRGKYVKYAMGEIVLVVIGILIALQINKWDESIKATNEEEAILNQLQQELSNNAEGIQKAIEKHEEIANDLSHMLPLLGPNSKLAGEDAATFKDAITEMLNAYYFNPKTSVRKTINNTGKIGLIKNQNLQFLISEIAAAEEAYLATTGLTTTYLQNNIVPYLNSRILIMNSTSAIPTVTEDFEGKQSTFTNDSYQVLSEYEFENMLSAKIVLAKQSANAASEIADLYSECIAKIHEELK
ncbi:MAG: DUF6090 family protein [Bacteroidota bacterium]